MVNRKPPNGSGSVGPSEEGGTSHPSYEHRLSRRYLRWHAILNNTGADEQYKCKYTMLSFSCYSKQDFPLIY